MFVLPGIMGKGTDDGAVQLPAPAPSVPPEELDKERSAATINYDWDEPYAQITSCGAGDPDEGYLIAEELIGRILGVQDAVGGWFRLVAPRDGDYAFTVVCPQLENDTFVMDMRLDGEAAGWWQFSRSDQPQTYVLSGVKAGQVLTWWDNDDTGRGYTLRDPFSLMIEIR